jgi:hypothetical protein
MILGVDLEEKLRTLVGILSGFGSLGSFEPIGPIDPGMFGYDPGTVRACDPSEGCT